MRFDVEDYRLLCLARYFQREYNNESIGDGLR